MQEVFQVILYTLGALLALSVLIVLCAVGLSTIAAVFQRYRDEGEKAGAAALSSRIWVEAAWFSEDPPTVEIIRQIANREDTSQIREQWRTARALRRTPKLPGTAIPDPPCPTPSFIARLAMYDAGGFRQGPVACVYCSHEWVAIRPADAKTLECPKCGKSGGWEVVDLDRPPQPL